MKHRPDTPIFGICLGNQILALAAGASIYKMRHSEDSVELWLPMQLSMYVAKLAMHLNTVALGVTKLINEPIGHLWASFKCI